MMVATMKIKDEVYWTVLLEGKPTHGYVATSRKNLLQTLRYVKNRDLIEAPDSFVVSKPVPLEMFK